LVPEGVEFAVYALEGARARFGAGQQPSQDIQSLHLSLWAVCQSWAAAACRSGCCRDCLIGDRLARVDTRSHAHSFTNARIDRLSAKLPDNIRGFNRYAPQSRGVLSPIRSGIERPPTRSWRPIGSGEILTKPRGRAAAP